ncbi:hypothetical protein [Actinacidiphila oryziradicis]|uniref:Lipoprotein n=1 Tax=Actinacidiphila oryziradicis TaxID=2571141 RepID=A0A4V5N0B6_9ACTN|nr:hypothetical protein [Actinacidiphila oryziradicis]TKA11389.1 hypothetical protein FCI23_11120 [Actinacidiphila oryziradicis]
MHHTRTAALPAAGAVLLLAGCGTSPRPNAPAAGSPAATQGTAASTPLDASAALKAISTTVTTARLTGVVTAENDGNHLLGRPNQYTSKVTFADSRISKADTAYFKKGDVELGGGVEVFTSQADAEARAKYIQAVTKSIPALVEYDYVHGATVVRVSQLLTPTQAGEYKTAAAKLG